MTHDFNTAVAAPGSREDGAGFADMLAVAAARKGFLTGATLAGAALAAGVALLMPNMYTATALIVPPQKEQSTASMLIGQLGPLAAVAGADIGLKSPGEIYVGLLGSRTIADHLIEKFELQALYRKKTRSETRDRLKSQSRFVAGRDSLLRIEVEDADPTRASAMANAYVAALDEQNRRLAVGEASLRRAFLEKQLNNEKNELAAAEEAMKDTQRRTGIIEVTGQTQVAIASIAQLRAQITAGEVALARLKMGATDENPAVAQTQSELDALQSELRKMERSSDRGPMLATSAIPEAGLGYIRRLRDLKYHEFLYELLSKQYEGARIDESKAAPPLQVIDLAVPPDKKSGPRRTLITGLGGVVGALISILAAYIQHHRKTASPPVQSTALATGA
jgi:uncharacterized protein involved in exopolysaccharide biosynthesis